MVPTPSPNPADLKRLGRYRIVRPLSKGGMALVYEARRESLAGVSPRVAIKLILPEHQGSETFRQLFINEARLGASMHHQNLVQIQDFDSEGDQFFLVMEYVEGLTLRRCIALCERYGLTIPMGVVAELGRQACDGLQYAHVACDEQGEHLGLVHRDIKPSNVILNPHGVVKVLDFGISKGRLREERKGSVKGTWGYMAPEQASGRGVSPASDVFGLAVVLYELAALRPAFQDKNKDEIKRLLADDHAARMIATLPEDYAPLVRVLIRATQRDHRARYTTAEDFGRALSALLPDPITARDEVVRFFERVSALEKGRKKAGAPVPAVDESQGSLQVEPPPDNTAEGRLGAVVTVLAALVIAGTVLAAALGLGTALLGDEVPESATAEASLGEVVGAPRRAAEVRPPPGQLPKPDPSDTKAEQPDPAEPVRVRVIRAEDRVPTDAAEDRAQPTEGTSTGSDEAPPTAVAATPAPEPTPAEDLQPDEDHGVLIVGAKQVAEVYLGGQFASVAPLKRKLPPGRYAVSIVAEDGRRRIVEVEVVAGERVRRVWDFERNTWR